MSRLEEIRELFAFNRWASHSILDTVATLSAAQYTRDLGSSFPSVAATLEHVLQADWIWLQRWQGSSPTESPVSLAGLSFAELRQRWHELEDAHADHLEHLVEADLERAMSYRSLAGEPITSPLWQMLRHVVNHSTYHRGQVTTMLRQLGVVPPSTDLIRYYRLVTPQAESAV